MVSISFIYDPPFFWFHVHTVINQHASLWWYQFAMSYDSCEVSVSFGILEGAMYPHAQLHLGEYFATSHYLNLTISNNPNQVQHIMFGISNVGTISKNPDVKIQIGTAKPTSPPSCSLLVRESTEPVGEENRFPQ